MAIIIEVKVVPSSGRRECKLEGARLKCFLKSAPEKGKANKELINYFAQMLKLPTQAIAILTGATSKLKRIKIETETTFEEICDALQVVRQMSIT